MKGIRREVVPYEVEALMDQKGRILSTWPASTYISISAGRVEALREAMAALDAAAGEKGAATS